MHDSQGKTGQPQWGGGGLSFTAEAVQPKSLLDAMGMSNPGLMVIQRANGVRSSTSVMYQHFF
jgi:hypothetical protein